MPHIQNSFPHDIKATSWAFDPATSPSIAEEKKFVRAACRKRDASALDAPGSSTRWSWDRLQPKRRRLVAGKDGKPTERARDINVVRPWAMRAAAFNAHLRMIDTLANQSVHVLPLDISLQKAIKSAMAARKLDKLELLLSADSTGEVFKRCAQKTLHIAAANGHADTVDLVASLSAPINKPDPQSGIRPLSAAAWSGNVPTIETLIERGADVNQTDRYRLTPLAQAACCGHVDAVRCLLDNGAEIDKPDKHGWTPLMHAVIKNHTGVVALLLERGANIEAANHVGHTPVMIAAEKGHKPALRLLLIKGGKLDARDKEGRTALTHAFLSGHTRTVKFLLEQGADPFAVKIAPDAQPNAMISLVMSFQASRRQSAERTAFAD